MGNEKAKLLQKSEAQKGNVLTRFFLQSHSSAITACVLVILVFSLFTDSFLTSFNLFNLSRTAAIYGFIAGAQLWVPVTRSAPVCSMAHGRKWACKRPSNWVLPARLAPCPSPAARKAW